MRITVSAGSTAGQQMIFEQDRVTFGRSHDNDVVIDLDAVSRHHGELVDRDGDWWLYNHSPNRTRLGKRRVRGKPRRLQSFHTVSVGGLDLMRVEVDPAPTPALGEDDPAEDEQQQDPDEQRKLSGRARVWGGIAAFWVVLLALVAVLSTLETDDPDDADLVRLTEQQITREITAPVDPRTPNERKRNAALEQARRDYNLLGSDRGALYTAYRSYRQAMALSEENALPDPIDELRYREVEAQLSRAVVAQYDRAYAHFRAGRYLEAERSWRKIVDTLYPDTDSRIFENTQRFLNAARRRTR